MVPGGCRRCPWLEGAGAGKWVRAWSVEAIQGAGQDPIRSGSRLWSSTRLLPFKMAMCVLSAGTTCARSIPTDPSKLHQWASPGWGWRAGMMGVHSPSSEGRTLPPQSLLACLSSHPPLPCASSWQLEPSFSSTIFPSLICSLIYSAIIQSASTDSGS